MFFQGDGKADMIVRNSGAELNYYKWNFNF